MKTADFLPPQAFRSHLDRRKNPRRMAILFLYTLLCGAGTAAVVIETQSQENMAQVMESPRPEAIKAKKELGDLLQEISRKAVELDPLTVHLSLPTVSWILAGLANAAGKDAGIEKIKWSFSDEVAGENGKPQPGVVLEVRGMVRGNDALVNLERNLLEFTGCLHAHTKAELNPEYLDVSNVAVELTAPRSRICPPARKTNSGKPRKPEQQ
ncbi:MAG: hypothetical protein ACE5H3_02250 [Planctomycetota bacterium]